MDRTTTTATTELVAATFLALADALEPLPPDAWDHPSLCDQWRVRDVIGHVTVPARYPPSAFLAELDADGGDVARTVDRLALLGGRSEPASLLDDLRSDVLHRWLPPGGGEAGAVVHAVIHGLDATVPLDVDLPLRPDAVDVVLDALTAGRIAGHFDVDVDAWGLEASDRGWNHGTGEPVRAPAAELALLLAGRRVGGRTLRG